MPDEVMKSVLIGTRLQRLQVSGIALDDAYFMAIQDNFESQYAAFTACFLRPEYTVLDIGANIGMTAAIMSSVVHEGNIYAFEPGPKVFEELEANFHRNNLANVHAHQLAISDKPGILAPPMLLRLVSQVRTSVALEFVSGAARLGHELARP